MLFTFYDEVYYYDTNTIIDEKKKVSITMLYKDALEKVKQKVENDIPQSD